MADSVNITVTSLEEMAVVSAQVTGTPESITPDIQEYIGSNGLSAYELWINEGNTGSVSDFLLSLKGEQGDKGDAGEKGERGIPGNKGDDGEKGSKGDALTFNDLTSEQKAELRGSPGPKGEDGYTPVKGVDYNDGTNGLDGSPGSSGAPGTDGREVEFQKTATHIQWRYIGGSWSNLVALADIKGTDGTNGTNGANGTNGLNGSDGTDGTDGVGISGIALQSTVGLNKTYRITFTNSSTYDFTVADGATGQKGETGQAGQNGSDASVTKSNVEAVLTGDISSHTHSTYLTRDQILNLL